MKNLHEALKTTPVSEIDGRGANYKIVKLQHSKTDITFSLHVRPMEYSTAGFQSTDLLGLIGFNRSTCPFFRDECYAREVQNGFDLNGFFKDFPRALDLLKQADQKLQSCEMQIPAPEGLGFFLGKHSRTRTRRGWGIEGDGHRAAKSTELKKISDQHFTFVLSFIEGLDAKGWTIHYIPINPPITQEIQAALDFLGVTGHFSQCPFADFEPCFWRFRELTDARNFPSQTAEYVDAAFDSHQKNFSKAVEELLEAHSILHRYGFRFLNIQNISSGNKENQGVGASPASPTAATLCPFPSHFDVAISFAKADREKAEALATIVRGAGFEVFYDNFFPEYLWGKELPSFFDEIYRKHSRYCVIFISKEYADREWTNHERRSAQARALKEKGKEYILPVLVDDADLPGMPPTVGHLSLKEHTIEEVANILVKKLGQSPAKT